VVATSVYNPLESNIIYLFTYNDTWTRSELHVGNFSIADLTVDETGIVACSGSVSTGNIDNEYERKLLVYNGTANTRIQEISPPSADLQGFGTAIDAKSSRMVVSSGGTDSLNSIQIYAREPVGGEFTLVQSVSLNELLDSVSTIY